ncbi:MAG: response regulator [Cyclobacteriaceae bacterium]|nr:response regulator [Cyclobacteriaceae bacterium]
MTIYIIEDDDLYAEFIKRSLAQIGDYKITVFSSAESCLEALMDGPLPDAFITDYQLPGKTGIEIYDDIKSRLKPENKFIMISALDDGNLVLSFIKKGVRDYVTKDDTVIDSLKAILEGNEDEYYLFKE